MIKTSDAEYADMQRARKGEPDCNGACAREQKVPHGQCEPAHESARVKRGKKRERERIEGTCVHSVSLHLFLFFFTGCQSSGCRINQAHLHRMAHTLTQIIHVMHMNLW